MSLAKYLLLVPALLGLLLCLAIIALVLTFAPPAMSAVASGLLLVAGLWFFLVRRSRAAAGSEAGLMGRQSSKDGLL